MRRLLAGAAIALLFPSPAGAQTDSPRFLLAASAGLQTGGNGVAQSFSVEKNLEPATITADADVNRALLVDVGVVSRIKGAFGVGVAVSYAAQTPDADVSARIPHPFFFNQPRTITGSASLRRSEVAAHVQAVYRVPGARIDLLISGGPSVFNVQQKLVTDVRYADVFPYNAPTFTSADTATGTATAIGFNAGADVTWKFGRHVGLGALVRFTRATKDVSVANNPAVTLDVGGVQLGAGVRVPF